LFPNSIHHITPGEKQQPEEEIAEYSGNPNLAMKELGGVRTNEKLDRKKPEAFFKVVWG